MCSKGFRFFIREVSKRNADLNRQVKIPIMKTQTRKNLRLKIIEYFDTQGRLAYASGIDEAVISKIVNCVRDPSKEQTKILCKLLKTKEAFLFKKV